MYDNLDQAAEDGQYNKGADKRKGGAFRQLDWQADDPPQSPASHLGPYDYLYRSRFHRFMEEPGPIDARERYEVRGDITSAIGFYVYLKCAIRAIIAHRA